MPRAIVESARARGSLAIDPKTAPGVWDMPPERVCAWDEDATTLAIEAARHVTHAPRAVVAPGIDVDAFAVALDIRDVLVASDPVAVATALAGPALAITTPDASSAIAALVDESSAAPAAARDITPKPRMVTATRALQERQRIPPTEPMPDTPMGAYVPWGTWTEDLAARLRLVAQRCTACARVVYPPRGACPNCQGHAFEPLALPQDARVYVATRIGQGGAPSEFALEQAQTGAYWSGIVEWPEQNVRVACRLVGYEEDGPAIGAHVRGVIRRLFVQEGRARYGLKFGPAHTS